jgi:hypothetical protein
VKFGDENWELNKGTVPFLLDYYSMVPAGITCRGKQTSSVRQKVTKKVQGRIIRDSRQQQVASG